MIRINLDDKTNLLDAFSRLKAGDRVLLSGTVITSRDAVHKEVEKALINNEKLPYNFVNSIIYYAGPTDTPPGKVIGAIGPTTSARMDAYAKYMKQLGVMAVIGKGERSKQAKEIYNRDNIIYFIATGGCGALLASAVKKAKVVALEHLGCESIKELVIEDFPVTVAYDLHEGDIFNG